MSSAHDRFTELLGELRELHARKANDYGDAEGDNLRSSRRLGISPYLGVLLRMNDKMYRLVALSQKERLVREETIADTLRDLAAYALLAIILLEEDNQERRYGC